MEIQYHMAELDVTLKHTDSYKHIDIKNNKP
jgi:hypothetical protein